MAYFTKEVNSLAPGRFDWNFTLVILKLISVFDGWGFSCKIALRWLPLDLNNDGTSGRQAMSHYLDQCGPRTTSPYGVTRPQWINPRLAKQPLIFNDGLAKLGWHFWYNRNINSLTKLWLLSQKLAKWAHLHFTIITCIQISRAATHHIFQGSFLVHVLFELQFHHITFAVEDKASHEPGTARGVADRS